MASVKSTTLQEIWIVRHGERIDYVDKTWTSDRPYDPPLTQSGLDMAELTAQRIIRESQVLHPKKENESEPLLLCSPFIRTAQTALPIARALKTPIRTEWGLTEGLRTGHEFTKQPVMLELQKLEEYIGYPVNKEYHSLLPFPVFPEERPVYWARFKDALKHILDANPEKSMVLVTHGQELSKYCSFDNSRYGYQSICEVLTDTAPIPKPDYCAIAHCIRTTPGGKWKVLAVNDASHAKKLEGAHF